MVRRRLGLRAVGHSGTLDPFATGLLVVMVGRATRLARFAEAARKRYRATVRFGTATDTDDGTGAVIAEATPEAWPSREALDAVLRRFTGAIRQRPPAYSAKHVAGERSHRLARRGEDVTLPEAEVMVHELRATRWEPPELDIEATVGKGTYLRALARDIGMALDVPAHCAALRREGVGSFDVTDAIAPDAVTPAHVRSALAMVPDLPRIAVDEAGRRELSFGRSIPRTSDESGFAALAHGETLLAVGEPREDGRWHPVVVLEPAT